VVDVDVLLAKTGGGADVRFRMVEFDLQTSNALLTVTLPRTHDRGTLGTGDDIYFWSFSSLSACAGQASFCGFNHFIDDDLAAGPVDTRLSVLSIAFFGLAEDTQAQILLPGNGTPVTVGKLQVTLPPFAGPITLNLANASAPTDATGLDRGARVDFGFGLPPDPPAFPHTIWRSHVTPTDNTPDVTDGALTFTVGNSNLCPIVGGPSLVSSIPAYTGFGISIVPPGGSLWRSAGNVVRLTFSSALPGLPAAGQLLIQELQPSGAFGPDLSASFAPLLETGNTVLRLRDGLTATPTATLGHRKWYAIRNTGGWTGVANFEAQFPSQVGDATGDNRTLQGDILEVNTGISCLSGCGDQNRKDVTGDGRVLQSDILETNTRISSLPVVKPSGH